MIEVRYNTETKLITGLWTRLGEHGKKLKGRDNELIAVLDVPHPNQPLQALLFDDVKQEIISNPDYIEVTGETERDLRVEIDALEARIAKLERA